MLEKKCDHVTKEKVDCYQGTHTAKCVGCGEVICEPCPIERIIKSNSLC